MKELTNQIQRKKIKNKIKIDNLDQILYMVG